MKRTLGHRTTRGGWIGLAASILALSVVFSSCRQAEDPSGLVPNGEDWVVFEPQIGGVSEVSRSQAVSKAVDPIHSKTAFANGDKMGFFLSLSAGKLLMTGNTHAKFTYDNLLYTYAGAAFVTTVGSPAGTIYYPYRTTKVDLWGIYPYDANAATYSADAYPWRVAADQTTPAAVLLNDFLSAVTRKVEPNNNKVPVALNFKHRMTLLRIGIAFPKEVDGRKLDPTTPIAEIYLNGLKVDAAINLNQEKVAPAAGAAVQTMRPLYLGYTEPVPADGRAMDSLFYQAIVVPQTVAAGVGHFVRLVVNFDNGTQGLFKMPVDADLALESGTLHSLSLSFDTQERLRLDDSKKVDWDKNAIYNHSSSVWQGDNQTITVGGTTWAKGFLVANGSGKGCRIGTPTDPGLFFQFGSLVGWDKAKAVQVKPASVTVPAWSSNYYTANIAGELYNLVPVDNPSGNGTGDACRYYLGSSWRMPNSVELFSLSGKSANGAYPYASGTASFDNGASFVGKPGTWWGPNFAARDTLIAPYMRHGGSFSTAQAHSTTTTLVWSSTLGGSASTAQTLSFDNTNFMITIAGARAQGGAIRCVWIRKIYEFTNPAMSGTTPVKLRFGFNFPCTWSITGTPAWLTLSDNKGTATVGAATMELTMTPNSATAVARPAILTITGTDSATGTVVTQTITVTQNP